MPENNLNTIQTQRQETQLSARQMQSLNLLQKPLPALMEELHAELERNPVLEADFSGMEIPVGDPLSAPDPAGNDEGEYEDGASLSPSAGETVPDSWQEDLVPAPAAPFDPGPGEASFRELSGRKTLEQQLLDELAVSDTDPRTRALAEWVIGSIDDTGYLRTPPADLAMAAGATAEEIQKALHLVQSFEPAGVGAQTPQECLLLQLERLPGTDPRLAELVRNYLPEIARNKLAEIARRMDIDMPELQRLIKALKQLSPYPGSALADPHPIYVAPEAEIVRGEDGHYHVVPKEHYIRLHIPKRYFDMLEDPALSAEDRHYVEEKINAAKEFIRSLEMRESTIRRIAGVIAAEQQDFFDYGAEHLKPLTMRRTAELLELHETTVSRASSGKFVQTPRGIFEFKYFFSTGYESADGEALSSRSVHERIRKLIDREDPAHPLSDDAISKLLAEDGLSVARRTVAKYRDALGIPGASVRRIR